MTLLLEPVSYDGGVQEENAAHPVKSMNVSDGRAAKIALDPEGRSQYKQKTRITKSPQDGRSRSPFRSELLPERAFVLIGTPFPELRMVADIYCPRIYLYDIGTFPDMQSLRRAPRVEHIDIAKVWKGLASNQADEILFWERIFRRALADLLHEKLRYLEKFAYISEQTHLHSQQGLREERPKLYNIAISLPDMVLATEQLYKQQYHRFRWFASTGRMLDAIGEFIRLHDCFTWTGPNLGDFRIGIQFKRSAQLSENSESPVEATWNPDNISFEPFDHPAIEGDEFQLIPRYNAPSRSCSALESGRHQEIEFSTTTNWLRWNAEINGFQGIVPFFSDITERELHPDATVIEDTVEDEDTTSYILHFMVKATFAQYFSSKARFEQTIRTKVAIKITKRRHFINLNKPFPSASDELSNRELDLDVSDGDQDDKGQSQKSGSELQQSAQADERQPRESHEEADPAAKNLMASSAEEFGREVFQKSGKADREPCTKISFERHLEPSETHAFNAAQTADVYYPGGSSKPENGIGKREAAFTPTFRRDSIVPTLPPRTCYTGFPYSKFVVWEDEDCGDAFLRTDPIALDKIRRVWENNLLPQNTIPSKQIQEDFDATKPCQTGLNSVNRGPSSGSSDADLRLSYGVKACPSVHNISVNEDSSCESNPSGPNDTKNFALRENGSSALIFHALPTPPPSNPNSKSTDSFSEGDRESEGAKEGYPWLIGYANRGEFLQMLRSQFAQEEEPFSSDEERFLVSCLINLPEEKDEDDSVCKWDSDDELNSPANDYDELDSGAVFVSN
ncbi:hypothetical protein PRK78_001567 [Emydomyces testavorans]|uniref:Uncharacterized protein n=1 Tax=Emydomyces testavorans TaxID=2070801 RepID=A0AAF0DCY4_9EURO|nr:hypothetical protein PRK78_001567 [Emydomyces testavorans]